MRSPINSSLIGTSFAIGLGLLAQVASGSTPPLTASADFLGGACPQIEIEREQFVSAGPDPITALHLHGD